MNAYPENDYRGYLMHWGKGNEAKSHKYISRRKGKNGKWIYKYANDKEILEFNTSNSLTPEDDLDLNNVEVKRPRPDRIYKDGKLIDVKDPLKDTKLAKSIDTAKQKANSNASKLRKALTKPINSIIRKHKLNKARSEISKRVFKKYDNYALNNQTPEGGMRLNDKNGNRKYTFDDDFYKSNRKRLVEEFAHKKSVDKKKSWKPSKRSNSGD